MKVKLKIDSRKMREALRDYARVCSHRTIPDILNHKTPHVISKAMANAPKTARSKITAELGTPSAPSKLALSIVASRAKLEGKQLTPAEIRSKAKAMINARLASVRYVSLGWLKPLAQWRSVRKPLKSKSLAAKDGFGKRANAFRHETRFANAAPGVYHAADALEQAIDQEKASMAEYARDKMAKQAKAHKGRK